MDQASKKTKACMAEAIQHGHTTLGIELGSTRIKAVLIDEAHNPIAAGSHDWENRLENGVWTYNLEDVWAGMQNCFSSLADTVQTNYGVPLTTVGAMGVSAMMHGYLAFDAQEELLVPFRTWRNTITAQAAGLLTEAFQFNIPQRWSIAHLYQAILNGEAHVEQISFLTTLAGYVHWKLTGKKVIGIGDASGMFPIDSERYCFHAGMQAQFDALVENKAYSWRVAGVLPQILVAGETAGVLTEEGARLLEPTGALRPGIPFCPPEGDAGTGMVATNSIAERTGNVSAGTSIFAMAVLERPLKKVHEEIDMVTTPAGRPVAMVHCNNCTSDLDAWVRLFSEVAKAIGAQTDQTTLYRELYSKALFADEDCGGLLSYNYLSGEHITGLEEGRPLLARMPDGHFTLPNLMRTLLFSALATLRMGMDILTGEEHVRLTQMLGHGGFFKTKGVGQRMMAAALQVPVSVMESAGEGGAWGIALLAAYTLRGRSDTLEAFLFGQVFNSIESERVEPAENEVKSFAAYMQRYRQGLSLAQAAVTYMN
ncbi:FGGY-family carbohydrate kinase [Christensenellaceae bacterium OttesenSCG-928-M15]|nr:FGGY-family carbohydrate kinase [Christensenellaceae bacterium OttesenSCG-928-M15]